MAEEENGAKHPVAGMLVDLSVLSRDVAEACADALLISIGQVLVCRGIAPTMELCREASIACLDEVIERTVLEGAKDR